MSEWQRLLRRARDLINPPKYPEYQEYRDEPDGAGVGAGVGATGLDEDALKMRRVQMVAGLAIVLSLAGGAWLYFSDRSVDPAASDPRLREALATEVMKSPEVNPTPTSPQDSLDDIKRWASDLERQMERGHDSTTPPSPAVMRPSAPYYGQGYDVNQPLVLPDPSLSYGESGIGSASGNTLGAPQPASVPVVSPARSTNPLAVRPASAPTVNPAPAPASTYPVVPPEEGMRSDSPLRPYQRRTLEPVTYEPRNVDPY